MPGCHDCGACLVLPTFHQGGAAGLLLGNDQGGPFSRRLLAASHDIPGELVKGGGLEVSPRLRQPPGGYRGRFCLAGAVLSLPASVVTILAGASSGLLPDRLPTMAILTGAHFIPAFRSRSIFQVHIRGERQAA